MSSITSSIEPPKWPTQAEWPRDKDGFCIPLPKTPQAGTMGSRQVSVKKSAQTDSYLKAVGCNSFAEYAKVMSTLILESFTDSYSFPDSYTPRT